MMPSDPKNPNLEDLEELINNYRIAMFDYDNLVKADINRTKSRPKKEEAHPPITPLLDHNIRSDQNILKPLETPSEGPTTPISPKPPPTSHIPKR